MKTVNNTKTVSAFDAKTHLSELLEKVRLGHSFVITRRGKPIAQLVPLHEGEITVHREDLIKALSDIRKRVKGKVDIRKYIDEGRK